MRPRAELQMDAMLVPNGHEPLRIASHLVGWLAISLAAIIMTLEWGKNGIGVATAALACGWIWSRFVVNRYLWERHRVSVRLGDRDLTIEQSGRAQTFPRSLLRGVVVVPKGEDAVLELRHDDRVPTRLEMPLEHARALVECLGFGEGEGRIAFRIRHSSGRGLLVSGIAGMGFLFALGMIGRFPSAVSPLWVICLPCAMIAGALLEHLGARLEIGNDGFVVEPAFGRARRYSFAEVDCIEPSAVTTPSGEKTMGLEITLRGGKKVMLAIVDLVDAFDEDASRRAYGPFDAASNALICAFGRWRDQADGRASAVETSPRKGTVEERVARILYAPRNDGAYRNAVPSPEELETLMLNPSLDPRVRVAALVAGKEQLSPESRVRVRASFDAGVAENVRIAADEILRAASEEEIEECLRKYGGEGVGVG